MSSQGYTITKHVLPDPGFIKYSTTSTSSSFAEFNQFFLLSAKEDRLSESVLREYFAHMMNDIRLVLPDLDPAQDADH